MDDRKRILLMAVIGAAAMALLCIILPGDVARLYTSIMQPLALFAGFVLAMQVSSAYAKELKKSFLFLSLFLLLYIPVNIQPLVRYLISVIGESLIYFLLLLQIIDYAMLLASCFYTVKVIDVKRMNRYGWALTALLLSLCLYIIFNGFQQMLQDIRMIPAGEVADTMVSITDMLIRIIDMAVILMLVPVLFLYLQYLKAKAQESITFTFIMGGLVVSLFSAYVFEMFGIRMEELLDYFPLNAAYLFGYLLMAVGLYANRKYDEWGFKMIEKALR